MVMDYAMLPPEVNSARMYAGAGSGPMMAAAAAWDRLAATLSSASASYRNVVSDLTESSWRGPASMSMTAAADPYVQWMNTTATQAEQTASQARAAAAAYEAAFAATVPPPVIAANRTTLATLVATNFFGQNTPAIAANQAEYGEMWTQDAAAMYSYAANSASAMALTPLTPAPQTANPAAASTQATTSAQTAATTPLQSFLGNLPDIFAPLNQFLSNNTTTGLNNFLGPVGTLFLQSSGPMFVAEGVQLFLLPLYTATGKLAMLGPAAAAGAATGAGLASSVAVDAPATALAGTTLAGSYGPGVSASVGTAAPVGKLSVPPSWGSAPQEVRLAAAALPTAGPSAVPQAGMIPPGGWVGGPVGSVVNTPRNDQARVRSSSSFKAIPQLAEEANADQPTQNRWAQPQPGASARASGLSERERDELDRLRDEMGELAMECDAMARLMKEAMR